MVTCFMLLQVMALEGLAGQTQRGRDASDNGYSRVSVKKQEIKVTTGDVVKKYTRYAEINNVGYLQRQGCVHTAVSIAASAFGKKYSPTDIYMAKRSAPYGEKYAVKRMKVADKNTALAGRGAITVTLAGEILKGMGIPANVQIKVPYAKTCRKIRTHLKKGLPVIVKCKDTTYKNTRFTTAHHAIVLVGLDKEDHVLFIDGWTAGLNTPAVSCNYAKLTVEELVRYFMYSGCTDTMQPYVNGTPAGGGYILVG